MVMFDENDIPDSKVHGANMGPTWVLSAPAGPHIGPMNLAIRGIKYAKAVFIHLSTFRPLKSA